MLRFFGAAFFFGADFFFGATFFFGVAFFFGLFFLITSSASIRSFSWLGEPVVQVRPPFRAWQPRPHGRPGQQPEAREYAVSEQVGGVQRLRTERHVQLHRAQPGVGAMRLPYSSTVGIPS